MVYHSVTSAEGSPQACSCALLPLRTNVRGPASITTDTDVVDEAINYFRANVLFRNFDVKGPSDKMLVYLTLVVGQYLQRFQAIKTKAEASKAVFQLALEPFLLPGDAGFVLGGHLTTPASRQESEAWRSWVKQAREEMGLRLVEKCFTASGEPNKYWLAFACRKFLNKQL
ncbi:hypothetical protein CYMTET_43173 [Cymbomonas tetramitiformis]|uniref:Actin-related protein 2/3 complex subunit 3 n=1 Tax=Cymbomonas tetramitiformis TaxID=36881 RepID=A0AAE0C2R8_9CHLO|nr:hypothetical protein CYMTET_43173 [Cymbomonas tetramitiformis]